MADAMLADELRIAARVALVDAHRAGRQRIAQPAGARAGKAQHGRRAERLLDDAEPAVAKLIGAAGRRAMDVEEADLLGLLVGDRRPLGQRIEVEIAEPLAARGLGAGLDHATAAAAAAGGSCGHGSARWPTAPATSRVRALT